MLAARDITVEIGGDVVRLRPTLRAAMRLERQFGGFAELLRLLSEGSYRATTAILAEHADPVPAVAIADVVRLAPQLLDHVLRLAGATAEKPKSKAAPKGKAMKHADYFASLFALGTGALGWTAQATLDTSPAEIEVAYAGRVDLIKAIFGNGKDEADEAQLTPSGRDPNAAAILRGLM
jgi:hypothetical protein